jgi:acyl-CoA synthetase (AMP-forming)/AMP-acid ligase II
LNLKSTLRELLAVGADNATAIEGPSINPLSYSGLREQISGTIAALNKAGIGVGDRVAIVLPNGPELPTCFLAVAAGATAAPLNPGYREEEFAFYLTDLGAKALIVGAGMKSPATAVAAALDIPIIVLEAPAGGQAGRFELGLETRPAAKQEGGGFGGADDVALVLHTSGTTSRPKLVPLTQRNLCASARNVSNSLQFSPADRGLTIMPLFHIHGLIAGVLAPLSAGSAVFCPPGFNALKFFAWMEEAKPTWYTAVPTMHQAILARAPGNAATISGNPLRFIRSSSASLPPNVLTALETVFAAPVIEAYGMTEAAHQMATNPLPPGERKLGSVGIAAGPRIAVMGKDGALLSPGDLGEIVIRGDNVTAGYESNPQANAEAFSEGWFRTGDQGVMDAEGYLSITGRLKEIINRGGEKISPREVDEVLMDHPAVAQVVTFAVPHDKLGEEVDAAVVRRDGMTVTERELRSFVQARLADFKVPRRIVFLSEIPKGPTGKLQRIGLAGKLGIGPSGGSSVS